MVVVGAVTVMGTQGLRRCRLVAGCTAFSIL
jgi:hypothetical protein